MYNAVEEAKRLSLASPVPPAIQAALAEGRISASALDHYRAFARRYPFPFDDFQVRAILAVLEGHSVIVSAPTGAGKTLVAEFAIHDALRVRKRLAYTTPLKALSNQKYGDFVRRDGGADVGLLTGDNSINPEANVVVMTTEVLRNMLYEDSDTLGRLETVVLDEVHYLQDPYRGAVWEEVLIHLPLSGRNRRHYVRELRAAEQAHREPPGRVEEAYRTAHRLACHEWSVRQFIGGLEKPVILDGRATTLGIRVI